MMIDPLDENAVIELIAQLDVADASVGTYVSLYTRPLGSLCVYLSAIRDEHGLRDIAIRPVRLVSIAHLGRAVVRPADDIPAPDFMAIARDFALVREAVLDRYQRTAIAAGRVLQ